MNDEKIAKWLMTASAVATIFAMVWAPFADSFYAWLSGSGVVNNGIAVLLTLLPLYIFAAASMVTSVFFLGFLVIPFLWVDGMREGRVAYPALLTLQVVTFIEIGLFGEGIL